MGEVAAFAPGHITGLFQICDESADLLLRGSRGAGVSIERGVLTKIQVKSSLKSRFKVRIDNVLTDSAEVSKEVLHSFLSRAEANYEITVDHSVAVPIGCGFGSSGAGAVSLALALNEALNLGLSCVEAAQIAHAAEVKCKTGLGTVIAEFFGGVEIRVKAGAPGIGEIKHVPLNGDYTVVCLNFGPIATREVLTNQRLRQRINASGAKLIDKLASKPELHSFLRFSRCFAEEIGLVSPRVRKVLEDADNAGLACSMMMFGDSVFTIIRQDSVNDALKIFRKHAPSKNSVIVSKIDFKGARLLA